MYLCAYNVYTTHKKALKVLGTHTKKNPKKGNLGSHSAVSYRHRVLLVIIELVIYWCDQFSFNDKSSYWIPTKNDSERSVSQKYFISKDIVLYLYVLYCCVFYFSKTIMVTIVRASIWKINRILYRVIHQAWSPIFSSMQLFKILKYT